MSVIQAWNIQIKVHTESGSYVSHRYGTYIFRHLSVTRLGIYRFRYIQIQTVVFHADLVHTDSGSSV